MKHITICGLRLEYQDFPAALPGRPTLLLLHEGLGCVAMWRDFPEKLAAATGGRLIVWSRAGYGDSQAPPEPRTPRYLKLEAEERLPTLLTAFGIEHPVLIGHSDGATIALLFAAAFPWVPLGVAVMAPHTFIEEATLAGIRAAGTTWRTTDWPRKLARFHADAPRVFADWHDTWLSPEYGDWNMLAGLPRISCPLLAIQGEQDEYATLRQIEVLAERVPGARALALPTCGHAPHREQEAQTLAVLGSFIGSLAAR